MSQHYNKKRRKRTADKASASPRRGKKSRRKKKRARSESYERSDSHNDKSSRSRSYSSHSNSDSLHLGRVPALYRDLDGLVDCKKGQSIRDHRYEVRALAGQGTFGTVLAVFDTKHKEEIALKVVRSVQKYLDASYVEIDILDKIRKADKQKKSHIVRLYGSFTTKINGSKHVCIAFEKCGMSLYNFIKKNAYRGFETSHILDISRQIIEAVAFCHSIHLTHTDLKLENVLLYRDAYDVVDTKEHRKYMRPQNSTVRLIDFGGATFEDQHHATIINTRQYRAPEVILGLPWSYPSDVWSCGCMMAELFTGELLFATHEDIEHIAIMKQIFGEAIPSAMVKKALKRAGATTTSKKSKSRRGDETVTIDKMFDRDGYLRWPEQSSGSESERHVRQQQSLEEMVSNRQLCELIRQCLQYDPEKRISCQDALGHAFFKGKDD